MVLILEIFSVLTGLYDLLLVLVKSLPTGR